MDWYANLDPMYENTYECYKYSVVLESDTLTPNHYIRYKDRTYRLGSFLNNQGSISFWYDIFDNVSKKCSFILFAGVKTSETYSYAVIDITEKGLYVSHFYKIQGTNYKSGRLLDKNGKPYKKKENDTIAEFYENSYSIPVEKFLADEFIFPTQHKELKRIGYLLKNGKWVKQTINSEESLIMKHFLFSSTNSQTVKSGASLFYERR